MAKSRATIGDLFGDLKALLKRHFCAETAKNHWLNKPLWLSTPLGNWLTDTPYTTRTHYYVPSTTTIIKYSNRNFTEYTKEVGRLTLYVTIGILPTLPGDAVQTNATALGLFLSSSAEGNYIMAHPNLIEENPTTFLEYITTLPEHA
eukprot:8791227-Ditylum_brightwellii.AAC.1